jgi:hypothetical protein
VVAECYAPRAIRAHFAVTICNVGNMQKKREATSFTGTLSTEDTVPMNMIRLQVRALMLGGVLLAASLAPQSASAQSQLDVAEARTFLGTWVLAMTSDMGAFNMDLEVTDMGGKLAASIGAPELGPMQAVTDITKDGESLVLAFAGNAQGQSFEATVTLEPSGEELSVYFDINQGTFAMSGTGTRSAN